MDQFDDIGKLIQKFKQYVTDIIANNQEAVRFLGLFLLLTVSFFVLYYLFQASLEWILIATAQVTGFLANVIGLTVSVDGVLISLGNMDIEIIHECTGIFALMIISSSILAYPTEMKKKAIGLAVVIPLILGLNLIRLLVLVYIGMFHTDLFDLVHSYLWQGTFLIFIILAWFLWIELVVQR